MAAQHTHLGRNVKRLREILGMKQETLAIELGGDWNQKKISLLESKDIIDRPLLEQIAVVLKLPIEAIENFNDEGTANVIANTVTTVNDNGTGQIFQINSTINTSEKWLEALEEIKRLNEEKIALYERMLKEKDEMMARLEKMTTWKSRD